MYISTAKVFKLNGKISFVKVNAQQHGKHSKEVKEVAKNFYGFKARKEKKIKSILKNISCFNNKPKILEIYVSLGSLLLYMK